VTGISPGKYTKFVWHKKYHIAYFNTFLRLKVCSRGELIYIKFSNENGMEYQKIVKLIMYFVKGRYLWRIAIAFHLGPRLLIVSSYYHFLLDFAKKVTKEAAGSLAKLLGWCFYLQISEIIGLCGISFVHNWEHYRKKTSLKIIYCWLWRYFFCIVQ